MEAVVDVDQVAAFHQARDHAIGVRRSEQFDTIVAGIPLKRAAKPADIAGACLFLASELSSYVTGATIDVNGGSHIH